MVRAVVLVALAVCLFGVNSMPGKRVRRGFNTNAHGSERGGASGSGYYNHGSDERDASVSREDGGCGAGGEKFENRETSYGRDDYNNERRHSNGRPR